MGSIERLITKIRQYKTVDLVRSLSSLSRELLKEENSIRCVTVDRSQIHMPNTYFYILPWDLASIMYLSIMYSNDYRGDLQNNDQVFKLINEYRRVDEEASQKELEKVDEHNMILYITFGLSQEEFWMQSKHQFYEQFCRNYEILTNINIIEDHYLINEALASVIGYDINIFTKVLWVLYIWGLYSEDFTDAQIIYNNIGYKYNITVEAIETVINYYSAEYSFYREKTTLGKNIFNVKPIVITQKGKRILVSIFYLMRLLSYGAYWVSRNYYQEQKSQKFINEFGLYFENYVEQVLKTCLDISNYKKIEPQNNVKLADWIVSTEKFALIIEQKSSLARADLKVQYPSLEELHNYLKNKIGEGYEQLNSTEKYYEDELNGKKVLKLLLHFEDLYMQETLERATSSLITSNCENIFLINISEFEKLIKLLQQDKNKFHEVLENKIYLEETNSINGKSFDKILSRFEVTDNLYIKNHIDYFLILNKMLIDN